MAALEFSAARTWAQYPACALGVSTTFNNLFMNPWSAFAVQWKVSDGNTTTSAFANCAVHTAGNLALLSSSSQRTVARLTNFCRSVCSRRNLIEGASKQFVQPSR